MLEVRQFSKGGKVELVSDDANAENAIVSEALAGTEAGQRWDDAEMEDELVIEIKPEEFADVSTALAQHQECWVAAERLDELEAQRNAT